MTETSNALRVDGIVLPMGADEPDVDDSIRIVDPDHNAILVAGNVEDCAAIAGLVGKANLFTIDLNTLPPTSLPAYLRGRNFPIVPD
jgi:hypothetical protein